MEKEIERRNGDLLKSLGRLQANLRVTANHINRLVYSASTPEELTENFTRLSDGRFEVLKEDIEDVQRQDETLYAFLLAAGRV